MTAPDKGSDKPSPKPSPHNAPDKSLEKAGNFVRDFIDADLAAGKFQTIVTRFPPEPNGYLHIGHAKSIHLNFGIARDYAAGQPGAAPGGARCHLRMDDTNPTKEDQEYIQSIQKDVKWLGFDWGVHYYHASDYFDQLYDWAVLLIKAGKAYVCDQSPDEVTRNRGTLVAPGKPSPHRNRTVEENLGLFARMKAGEFPNGSRTLRAKIDMASPNLNMRDPVMYRILHAPHPHVGDKWCIYPMYDYAHGQCDWIEGITHSICTLEFEAHRPLYDWFVNEIIAVGGRPGPAIPALPTPLPLREGLGEGRATNQVNASASSAHTANLHAKPYPNTSLGGRGTPILLNPTAYPPRQYEFARLNMTYTMMSKRKLLDLVKENHVKGWDDPRMPTISGMRRRGYTPQSIRAFCEGIGVARRDNTIELARLEFHVREDLNKTAPRVLAVINPLKVVIENYAGPETDLLDAVNNPEDPSAGSRKVPFSKVIYIDRDDFMESPPPKYFRLAPGPSAPGGDGKPTPGPEVRLRYAYFIRCTGVIKDAAGNIVELRATYDPATRGGDAPDGRKVKGTIHWVSAEHAIDAQVRLYDTLFTVENPNHVPPGPNGEPGDPNAWRNTLNPNSLVVVQNAKVEPSLKNAKPGQAFQFERTGYFCVDEDSTVQKLVFNRTVTLKDSWAKMEKKA